MFCSFDNKALLRESNMTDLEAFFPEDDYSMYSEQPQQQPAQSSFHPVANMTASTDYNHPSMSLSPLAKQQPQSDHASNGSMFTGASITKIHLPNEGEMQVMAMPFIENIQINGSSSSEPYWRHCIEETCRFPSSASSAVTSTTLSLTRRRRRPQCSIPLASFVMPRTPRNVPLFISPLSHHPDKYIGAVLGDTFSSSTSFTNVNSAPFYVQRMESNALTRADIKGLVRIAERDCLVINSRIAHWETQGAEAQGALRKAEAALATVKAEQQAEMNRYKHGVEEPLAALPSTGVSSSGSGVDPAGGHLHEMFDDEGKESHPSSSPRVGTSKARRGLKNEAQKSSVTQVSDSMSAAPKGGSKEPASVEVSKRKTSTGAATTSAGTPALTEFSSVGGGGAGSKVVNKKHPTKR